MSHEERDAPDGWTARVKRDVAPPPEVRDRIAAGLRNQGMLPGRRARVSTSWVRVAAVVTVFAAGWIAAATYYVPDAVAGPRFVFLLYGETSAPHDVGRGSRNTARGPSRRVAMAGMSAASVWRTPPSPSARRERRMPARSAASSLSRHGPPPRRARLPQTTRTCGTGERL